jgi:steroid 5-alpha reductase family enzyme
MTRAFLLVSAAYVLAGAAAVGTVVWFHALPPIVILGLADLVATIVIFLGSVLVRNSSMYDPYWSVAPVLLALFWLSRPVSGGLANPHHLLMFILLCLWALRLTANWAMQWHGLGHEDWRYQDIQQQTGRFYWPVSFLGIHLMPTMLVFLGCLSLWPTLSDRNAHLSWLDGVAALVTLSAVLIETTADLQMRRLRRRAETAGPLVLSGLWSISRHPNYFGEVLFWWGLYLFVPLAYPAFWWAIAGPLAISLLFLCISIPLMERHLLAGHPGYAGYQRRVSRFLPWFPRREEKQTAPGV